MGLKSKDMKKLWARSGNMCSFPGCCTVLAPEKKANRVLGEEAHIKGEKPTAPRFDPKLRPEEREGYENRILLCPNHHTEIDADEETWTVEILHEVKAKHELQVEKNWLYPELMDELKHIFQKFEYFGKDLDLSVTDEIIEHADEVKVIRVDASREGGVRTNVIVTPGQKLIFFSRGLISYNSGLHFATPEGIICNEYGIPFMVRSETGNSGAFIWQHEQAYKTDGGVLGRIGSLIGWINTYSEEKSFLIGTKKEVEVSEAGRLYLSVNDAKGTYGDNDGEFRVDVRIAD